MISKGEIKKMAEFDKTLDKTIKEAKTENEKGTINIAVMQYNEGVKKLQLSRMVKNGEEVELRFAKLGRLTKEEAQKLLDVLPEMIKEM